MLERNDSFHEKKHVILITGVAGFIGFHLTRILLDKGLIVIGIDHLEPETDSEIKRNRLAELGIKLTYESSLRVKEVTHGNFTFFKSGVQDTQFWHEVNEKFAVDQVIHLAIPIASPESLNAPKQFLEDHFLSFMNVLDFCTKDPCRKLFYAHTLTFNLSPIHYTLDEVTTLNKSIQSMNDLWASAYWELYDVESLALEFPIAYGPWSELNDNWEEMILNSYSLEGSLESNLYCHISIIIDQLVELISNSTNFNDVICTLGSQAWKTLSEIQSVLKTSGECGR